MLAALVMQFVVVVCASLATGLLTDWTNARFLLLGGAAALIPNALFALRLALHRNRPPESYPIVFFAGELVKIVATVGLLALFSRPWAEARWLPLLIGFIATLKAPLASPLLEPALRRALNRKGRRT